MTVIDPLELTKNNFNTTNLIFFKIKQKYYRYWYGYSARIICQSVFFTGDTGLYSLLTFYFRYALAKEYLERRRRLWEDIPCDDFEKQTYSAGMSAKYFLIQIGLLN